MLLERMHAEKISLCMTASERCRAALQVFFAYNGGHALSASFGLLNLY